MGVLWRCLERAREMWAKTNWNRKVLELWLLNQTQRSIFNHLWTSSTFKLITIIGISYSAFEHLKCSSFVWQNISKNWCACLDNVSSLFRFLCDGQGWKSVVVGDTWRAVAQNLLSSCVVRKRGPTLVDFSNGSGPEHLAWRIVVG